MGRQGRKQYRYHPLYRASRDQAKFSRMIAFGTVLALIRRRVQQDLDRRGLPKEKVLAAVVRLLETTYIRVGNDEYAKENDSFGLTTMRDRHVRIAGSKLLFRFRGKSGQDHTIELTDQRLARIVKQCQDLPGYELFQYVNEAGEVCRVDSADVNATSARSAGRFHGQGFPHLGGHGARGARACTLPARARVRRRASGRSSSAIKSVAQRLGNRPATCRKYYIHPAIIDAYTEGLAVPRHAAGRAAGYGVRRAGPAAGGVFGDGADRRVSAKLAEGGVRASRPLGVDRALRGLSRAARRA